MWQAMIVAMMTPTILNWLFAYDALVSRSGSRHSFRAVGAFAAGYFVVWLGYSIAGAALQVALQRTGILDHSGKLPPAAAGMVLIGAGVVYFTPLSRACLRHCRNPLTYFLAHWDNGPHGGFRFGVVHGAYCVGCCWALMLTGFAMGVMNLVWMGFLTVLVCVEKLVPHGDRIAAVVATAMIAWGVTFLI
jgi:predicted metal-binding membrane protein